VANTLAYYGIDIDRPRNVSRRPSETNCSGDEKSFRSLVGDGQDGVDVPRLELVLEWVERADHDVERVEVAGS